jgi:hypothetical protein
LVISGQRVAVGVSGGGGKAEAGESAQASERTAGAR